MDVDSLINRAGGVMELAGIARVARTTVLHWRKTGHVPGSHLYAISVGLKIPQSKLVGLLRPKGKAAPGDPAALEAVP